VFPDFRHDKRLHALSSRQAKIDRVTGSPLEHCSEYPMSSSGSPIPDNDPDNQTSDRA